MRPILHVCIGLLCVGLPGLRSAAQEAAPAGALVDVVEVEGNVTVSEGFVRSVVRTVPGEPLDRSMLDDDVNRLLRTGRFANASAVSRVEAGRVIVVFRVEERPTVTDVRFQGNAKLKDKKLAKLVPIAIGDPVDGFAIREGQEAITAAYREEGYGNVIVQHDAELLGQTGELVFIIEEGPRIRVREIRYEGNTAFTRRELNKQVATRTYLWIFRDGDFDPDQAEQDAVSIQDFYRGEGYLDARVGYRIDPGEKPDDLILVFLVSEGTRYRIESIEVEGNTVFTTEELLAVEDPLIPRPTVGAFFKQLDLDRLVRDIQKRYGDLGYIYLAVRGIRTFAETPDVVRLRIEIDEGEQYGVGRVVVRGNHGTKDKVARRALELYPDEDVINVTKLREAEQRLRETQIFDRASIRPVGEAPGVRDLVIDVQEADRVGDFIFGVGVNTDSGLAGNVVFDIRNFDLFDWPRSFREFIKLRSFRGAGQRLRIEAQPGTEFNRFRIDFVEPYFLDKPIRLSTSAYFYDRERESWTERRVGGNVSFGKRFTKGWLKDWYGEIALRSENVNVRDLDLFAPRDVRDVEGDTFLTSVKGTLARDRTDSRLIPTKGDLLRLSWEQFAGLGGDDVFAKVMASYTWHKTLLVDQEERKHVLSLRGDVGAILGDAPVFERFYAGGIGTIRGFEFRGVSPRQGLDDDPIGGDFMALAKAEYTFPLVGEMIRGVLFSDMGTVEEEFALTTWRASVGIGVRLHLDFFGPVPMEFDLAVPISKGADDEEQAFSFFIGATF